MATTRSATTTWHGSLLEGSGRVELHWVLRCPCGETLTGDTEDDIVDVSLAHLRAEHPQMEYEREHILFMAVKYRR